MTVTVPNKKDQIVVVMMLFFIILTGRQCHEKQAALLAACWSACLWLCYQLILRPFRLPWIHWPFFYTLKKKMVGPFMIVALVTRKSHPLYFMQIALDTAISTVSHTIKRHFNTHDRYAAVSTWDKCIIKYQLRALIISRLSLIVSIHVIPGSS